MWHTPSLDLSQQSMADGWPSLRTKPSARPWNVVISTTSCPTLSPTKNVAIAVDTLKSPRMLLGGGGYSTTKAVNVMGCIRENEYRSLAFCNLLLFRLSKIRDVLSKALAPQLHHKTKTLSIEASQFWPHSFVDDENFPHCFSTPLIPQLDPWSVDRRRQQDLRVCCEGYGEAVQVGYRRHWYCQAPRCPWEGHSAWACQGGKVVRQKCLPRAAMVLFHNFPF